jgi:arginine decarboxylase-like protein
MTVVAIIEDPAELTKIIELAKKQEQGPQLSVCARSPPEQASV